MKEEKRLIEAALFMSSRAMTLEEFRTLTGIGALGYIQGVLAELKKDYDERGSAIEIAEMEGKYSIRVRADLLPRVRQYAQDTEISKSALRTLAYLSKHDGMLKSELVRKVGTQAYLDVRELIEAGFLKAHKSGRTSKLTLTEKFKIYFVQEKQGSAPAEAPSSEEPPEKPPEQTTLQ